MALEQSQNVFVLAVLGGMKLRSTVGQNAILAEFRV